ncbi:MAG: hypothetical protein ACLTS6_20455 [Anaerobutyricum sp.]
MSLLGMVDELKAKDMFELKDIYEVRERLIVCQTLIEHLRSKERDEVAQFRREYRLSGRKQSVA